MMVRYSSLSVVGDLVLWLIPLIIFITSCGSYEEESKAVPTDKTNDEENYPKYIEYRLTADYLDYEIIDGYPQKIIRIVSESASSVVEIKVFAPYRDFLERWNSGSLSKKISDYDYKPEIAEYLKATDLIESESDEIKSLNNFIASGEDDFLLVTAEILKFTTKNIKYEHSLFESISRGESSSKSALWTLHNQEGSSAECTNLFIAICRNRGIPARFVLGTIYDASFPGLYHMWAEVYLPGIGWYPVDPAGGTMNFTDIAIRLFVGKDYTDCGVNLRDLKVAVKKITEDYP